MESKNIKMGILTFEHVIDHIKSHYEHLGSRDGPKGHTEIYLSPWTNDKYLVHHSDGQAYQYYVTSLNTYITKEW